MKTWLKIVLAVVVVLAVGGAGIAIGTGLSGGDEGAGEPARGEPPVSSPSDEGGSDSEQDCPASSGPIDGDTLSTAPEGKWVKVPGLGSKVPQTEAGPLLQSESGVPRCFEGSAEGAVIASYWIWTVLSADSSDEMRKAAARSWLSESISDEVWASGDSSNISPTGFAVIEPVGDDAVTVAVRVEEKGTGRSDVVAMELVWESGTWKSESVPQVDSSTVDITEWES